MKDNYDLWVEHDAEQEKWLRSRPKCEWCKEHIQDEKAIEIDGCIIHEDCIEEYMKKHYGVKTEDYVG